MNLNLTDQETEKAAIAPKLLKLKQLLDERKLIWDKLPDEKRKKWIQSGKDPVLDIAWDMYKYLHKNFFKGADRYGDI